MQTAATATQDFSITTGAVTRPATAYIFYPLNMIAPALRASVPDWKAGGTLRPELATLRHRNGYIRQCEIVECRQHMVARSARNIIPGERRHMVGAYTLTENGVSRRIDGGDPDNPLLFSPWYPDQELEAALGLNDGLVRMPIDNAAEMVQAQYFLFPDWDDYVSGKKDLPSKLVQIRDIFLERQRETTPGSKMYAVATAALRACDLADAFGRAHVARENAMYAEAQAKGWAWSYGVDAELYMEQLGLQRRDNLAQEQASKIDRLADVLAEAFAPQNRATLGAAPAPAPIPEEPKGPEPPPPPKTKAAPAVGGIARVGEKVGQIVAVTKNTVTIEATDGEVIKAKPDEIELGD